MSLREFARSSLTNQLCFRNQTAAARPNPQDSRLSSRFTGIRRGIGLAIAKGIALLASDDAGS
jgi:hypothetical protein